MNQSVIWKLLCFAWALTWIAASPAQAENGYRLWLRYDKLSNPKVLSQYHENITEVVIPPSTQLPEAVANELRQGLSGLLGKDIPSADSITQSGAVVIITDQTAGPMKSLIDSAQMKELPAEGFLIHSTQWNSKPVTVITAQDSLGAMYGVFHLLRLIQTEQSIEHLDIRQTPTIQRRLLNHWDNLNGSVERGYAGMSIWKWDRLDDETKTRIKDYARANASIGINGAVVNNVNSQAEILNDEYLRKASTIADILRPYGIKLYFSIRFTSPKVIGGLPTADPLDAQVQKWWKDKAAQIYKLIPDFGGFLVKAYSEGQPGPQQYGRSHADGANVLGQALKPHGGIVMWRSFVYDLSIDSDRTKCAYLEFVPLDGKFASNVLIQTKNGPIDFQPREPFSPLFGAMDKTPLMMELQITQEYTGQAKHLVYLAPQWKEVLDADTFAQGAGTTVANIVSGKAEGHALNGIAGVSGIGTDRNWSGHHFSQANWYAFGRLAWDPDLSSEQIAEEWTRMTWSNDPKVVKTITNMMAGSWEACIDYMTPLGLHHLMAEGHHYGPQPDYVHPGRHDWSSTYYHKAGRDGIGFDRSETGTNAISQYHEPLCSLWNSVATCPDEYLLWFHHVPWDHPMKSGKTLWGELQLRYENGVKQVEKMLQAWNSLESDIDAERFEHVKKRLEEQHENAALWRDTCLNYFGQFANPQTQKGPMHAK